MLLLIKNLLFTVLVPGTVSVLVPWFLTQDSAAFSGPTIWLARMPFLVGGVIYAWCVWDFASFGGATPAPIDAPKKLVVRGLYRLSRNPMYVGVLTVISGWLLFYLSWEVCLYAVLVFGVFQSFIVYYEEPHLEREFGDQYIAYKSRVGRWFLPPMGT